MAVSAPHRVRGSLGRLVSLLILAVPALPACGGDAVDEEPGSPPAVTEEIPRPVAAVLERAECLDCHTLLDRGHSVGPSLTRVGSRLSAERLRTKILDPSSSVSDGYENLAGTMPSDFRRRLSDEELDLLVGYLADRR